jgi:hypothetical protein
MPLLPVCWISVCRSHERLWLSLLPKGRLLVLKGGIHQFMLQPGIVETYRQHAIAFASNAQWEAADSAAAAAAVAAGRPESQPGPAAKQQDVAEGAAVTADPAAVHSAAGGVDELQDGVALLAGPDGTAVVIEQKRKNAAAGSGVGLGEVVRNVWAQRGDKQKA